MRLSVECAFPHLGKRSVALRKGAFCLRVSPKGAFCDCGVTETRNASLGTHAVVLETAPGQAVLEVTPDAQSPPSVRFKFNYFDIWAIVRVIWVITRI